MKFNKTYKITDRKRKPATYKQRNFRKGRQKTRKRS